MTDHTDKIRKFSGFPPGESNLTSLPAPFFDDLLPLVDDLAELKVLLFCFWALPQKEGEFPYLRYEDFANHEPLMAGLAVVDPASSPDSVLNAALDRAVAREVLLHAEVNGHKLYFINDERGCLAIAQLASDNWRPGDLDNPVEILPERPTIYQMYEENIGPLTPMITDDLKDLEGEYPTPWLEEAMHIAVESNKRNLRYIKGILKRWHKEGRQTGDTAGGRTEKDGKRYISGELADYINH